MIDTHCHLDLEPLYSQRKAVITAAENVGVNRFIIPGVHPDNWSRIAALAEEHSAIMSTFGVHPLYADCVDDTLLERLSQHLIKSYAIGEIGLDPGYAVSMQKQEAAFREQLKLAIAFGLPVLIHCRQAFQRTLEILKDEHVQDVGGIMHAFSGSVEMAREFVKLGLTISISGVVTYPDAKRCKRLVHELPLQHLVVETDAPDLPPGRYRGQANQPAWLVETIYAVAAIKNLAPHLIAEQCTANSRALFRK